MNIMKLIIIICICMPLVACTSSRVAVGSKVWYDQRRQEIERAYMEKSISDEQYLKLKNEVDAIRLRYTSGRAPTTHSRFGFSSHGGSTLGVGVGVGF